jgi:RNA polymerase sigma factor (sigma-70 family)
LNSETSQFDALIAPIQDQMIRSIWRVTHVAEDAEDALQESLAVIWRNWPRVERHPCPRALILRICFNCACDVLRRRLRRRSREETIVDPDALAAEGGFVGEGLQSHELRDVVSRALLRLPRRQATAVVMRHVLELRYAEIAGALGCSEPTARVHVNRACKKLSRLLAHLAPRPSAENSK